MKKTLWIVMLALMMAVMSVSAFSGSGSGIEGDPYQITTCEQLEEMNDDLTAYYTLTNDIDCSDTINWNDGYGFIPIGWVSGINQFTGVLDGQGHTISDLYMNFNYEGDGNYLAMFSKAGGGSIIKNMNIENINLTGYMNVGGLVGQQQVGLIDNVNISGQVTAGESTAGGLIGYAEDGAIISNSHSSVSVSAVGYDVGGLIGEIYEQSVVENCSASGPVWGASMVGGLVGYSESGSTIIRSYATGDVTGGGYCGGLLGYATDGGVAWSYAEGTVTCEGSYAGGFIADTYNVIVVQSYSLGDVYGLDWGTGGFIGFMEENSAVFDSYARGNVYGGDPGQTGGFVGYCYGGITNSYSTGSSIGGGLVGGVFYGGGALLSYWDTETSGLQTSAAGVGKTTLEMQTLETFSGWDFVDTWEMCETGYPVLKVFGCPPPPCTPNWVCNAWGTCRNRLQNCTGAVDGNVCGVAYEGNYSEFGTRTCGGGGSGGGGWPGETQVQNQGEATQIQTQAERGTFLSVAGDQVRLRIQDVVMWMEQLWEGLIARFRGG